MYRIIRNLQEGELVQYVGVHAVNWKPEWGQPHVGFVEVEEEPESDQETTYNMTVVMGMEFGYLQPVSIELADEVREVMNDDKPPEEWFTDESQDKLDKLPHGLNILTVKIVHIEHDVYSVDGTDNKRKVPYPYFEIVKALQVVTMDVREQLL